MWAITSKSTDMDPRVFDDMAELLLTILEDAPDENIIEFYSFSNIDEGEIDLHGHSISLLSIGVGFQNKLSGRENIFLSGMLLGFERPQIEEKLDEIIEFSELGDFIDRPVKTYSSGMYSKLAFSITAILETEIMLIDEVLSVGDAKFKKKSYEKMRSLIMNKDRTVVIVSHSSDTLRKLCDNILWLHDGEVKMQGTTEEVLPLYEEFMS